MSIRGRLERLEDHVRRFRLGECSTCHGVRLGWTFPDGTRHDGTCPACGGSATLRWTFGPAPEVGLDVEAAEAHPPQEPMPC